MFLAATLFVLGLVLLVYCSERMVFNAEKLAQHAHISEFLVGVLVVAVGTSLPELITSIMAATAGHSLIALGNVIGSNIANIGLVIGAAGIAGGLALRKNKAHIQQAGVLLAMTALVVLFGLTGTITHIHSYILLTLAALYLWWLASTVISQEERAIERVSHRAARVTPEALLHVTAIMFAALGLWLSARWIVDGVLVFSAALGIGHGVVAMTAVAIGTSLPELSVAVQAARTRHAEILIGDILGASTLNLLLVLGMSALVMPIPVSPAMLALLPVMGLFALLLWVFLKIGKDITRKEASILLVGYVITITAVGLLL